MLSRRNFWSFIFLSTVVIFASVATGAEFADWSADFTHPYLSAWHPGFSSSLYGTNPYTGQTGWKKYVVEGQTTLGGINCLPIHCTTIPSIPPEGDDYYVYLAQDTDGNIRYLKEGNLSFLPDPPIFLPATTSDGKTWSIQYQDPKYPMGQHRFSIYDHGTYKKNAFGFGPYEDSLYVRHYWEGALVGLIVVVPRFGIVHYDGRDIAQLQEAALAIVEGEVSDAWSNELISGATVWLDHNPPRQTLTDADGIYRFVDLPQRAFQLDVTKLLYEDFTTYVTTTLGGTTKRDVALIPLHGSIAGVVQNALDSQPISGATVQIDGNDATRQTTGSDGLYRIDNVRIGTHKVQAWATNFNFAEKDADVTADTITEINFALESINGSIEGVLRDSVTSAPVSGGTVQIDGDSGTQYITGTDGSFRLEDVIPGLHYLQAWGPGYLFFQKRVTVEANETVNVGDVFLVPESSLLPAGTDFYFDEGPDGWQFYSIPDTFDEPQTTSTDGHLGLSAGGHINCFGFWESPRIAFVIGKTYRARFTLRSDQTDPICVPTARLRINAGNSQTIATLMVNSLGDGEASPTTTPSTYDVVFSPPISSASCGITLSFDLANIGSEDNPDAWLYLESVTLEAVAVTPEQE